MLNRAPDAKADYREGFTPGRPDTVPLPVARRRRNTLGGMKLQSLACVLFLLLAAPLAQAQWMWKDKDGRVTASDRPPPRDVADKDILQRPAPEPRRAAAAAAAPAASAPGAVVVAPPAAPTSLEREVAARKKAAEAEQAAKTKVEEERNAARRAENCRNARNHLANLEMGTRVVRVNDKGEREVLEDTARADESWPASASEPAEPALRAAAVHHPGAAPVSRP
jgi:type IV secretory pathway VirB10-like protein